MRRDVLTRSSRSVSLRMSLRRPHSTERASARAAAENDPESLTPERSSVRGPAIAATYVYHVRMSSINSPNAVGPKKRGTYPDALDDSTKDRLVSQPAALLVEFFNTFESPVAVVAVSQPAFGFSVLNVVDGLAQSRCGWGCLGRDGIGRREMRNDEMSAL